MTCLPVVRAALVVLALELPALLAVAPSAAAHGPAAGEVRGVAIPSLFHSQMAVYARHYGAIMRLAARQWPTDDRFNRIRNFAAIQRSWCLWGLAPRAISDEESPFNECSHAYLAAARALLDAMRARAKPGSDVERLGQTVDQELLLAGVPVMCGYSGEAFDTARHVVPQWTKFGEHGPTLAMVSGGLCIVVLGVAACLFPRGRGSVRRRNG